MRFFGSKKSKPRDARVSDRQKVFNPNPQKKRVFGNLTNKRAAAVGAAALLLFIGAILYVSRPQVFLGIFADDSGLAMVREGNAAGITKDADRKKELHVLVNDALGVTNPAYAESESDRMISSMIFEPLMRLEGDGHFTGVLAKNVTMSEDGTSCQITLNKKIHFSDGTDLTADDVAFSIAAMCLMADEESSSLYLNIEGVEELRNGSVELPAGIEVNDADHVTVRFAKPSPDNVMIAGCQIQKRPQEMENGISWTLPQLSAEGTGTGAYVKEPGRDGGNIRLTASSYYREKIRDIKAVEFVPYGTYEVADAISRGQIDVAVLTGNGDNFDPFYDAKQFTIYEKPMDSVLYLSVNRDCSLLRRTDARRAAALSIDRDALAGGALSKYLMKAETLAWENSALAGENPAVLERDTARKLLNGVKEQMENPSMKLVLPILAGNDIQKEIAKEVKSGLDHTGFSVEVKSMDQAEYLKEVYMLGNYDLLISSSGGWQSPSSYDCLVNDSQGLTVGSANEQLQSTLSNLERVYDWKSMEKALKETNTVINQTMPVIPVARQKEFVAISADLTNYKMSQYDSFLNNVWEIRVKN